MHYVLLSLSLYIYIYTYIHTYTYIEVVNMDSSREGCVQNMPEGRAFLIRVVVRDFQDTVLALLRIASRLEKSIV